MKGFINPRYPMSNRNMKLDKTWGGTNPLLRPGICYPKMLLPRVLPDRPGYIGTSKVDVNIVKVDKVKAENETGSPAGFRLDPPEHRYFAGNWEKRLARIKEAGSSPDPHPLHRVMKLGKGFKKHFAGAGEGEVYPEKTELDPAVFSRSVKQFAYDFGAEAVGITRPNRDWVYQMDGEEPLPEEYTHVIIVVRRHPHWRISHSPAYTSDIGSHVTYHHTSFMAVEIADWIRELGYPAKVNSSITGYDIMMVPHEIGAGLGEQSRIGVNLHLILGVDLGILTGIK